VFSWPLRDLIIYKYNVCIKRSVIATNLEQSVWIRQQPIGSNRNRSLVIRDHSVIGDLICTRLYEISNRGRSRKTQFGGTYVTQSTNRNTFEQIRQSGDQVKSAFCHLDAERIINHQSQRHQSL